MKRRTIFGPDMGNSEWTPIDEDDEDAPFAVRPVAVKDLVLPKDGSNSYQSLGKDMYALSKSRDNSVSEGYGQKGTFFGGMPTLEDRIAFNVTKDKNVTHPGWQPRKDGVGGKYIHARRNMGDYVVADFLNAEASAGGGYNFPKAENGNLTGVDLHGDVKLGGNLLNIEGRSGPQKWGEVTGGVKILNLAADGDAYFRAGSGVSGPPGAGVKGNVEGSLAQVDGQGKVMVPLTYLNNRLRALNKAFGLAKGPREELDLIVEGGGKAGFGARAGCEITEKTKNIKKPCYFQPWFIYDYFGNAYLRNQNSQR